MVNLNDIFAYYTVKYAMVRDWRLGVLQKFIMLLIFTKILGLQMFYHGLHLLEVPVFGSARGNAQQPTKNGCNPLEPTCLSDFTPLTQLPYCIQYDDSLDDTEEDGKKADADADGKKTEEKSDGDAKDKKTETKKDARRLLATGKDIEGGPKGDCVLYDAPAMTRGRSPVPGTIFLPTRIVSVPQVKGCKPSKSNGYSCDTKPWVRKPDGKETDIVIADIERFTVLVNQAFETEGAAKVSGRAADFEAYVKGHEHLEDLHTKHEGYLKHVDKLTAAAATEWPIPEEPDPKALFKKVFKASNGDVMAVADILRMADVRGSQLLDLVRPDGESMRSQGAVIDMSIEYSNKKKFDFFGSAKPHYTITCKLLPMRYYKIIYEEMSSEEEREFKAVHGLLVLMRVHGKIRMFSLSHILTFLSTALVSLAMATTLTDYMMQYLFRFSGKYGIIKYQPTEDFGHFSGVLDKLKAKMGGNYDPKDNKAIPTADILNNCAEAGKPPEGAKLLACLLKFEQRLNRVDGMDELNATVQQDTPADKADKGAAWLNTFEKKYRASEMGCEPAE